MFEGRIKELGEKLSASFTERARHYFAQAKETNNPTLNVIGAALAEVANVIKKETSDEAKT